VDDDEEEERERGRARAMSPVIMEGLGEENVWGDD